MSLIVPDETKDDEQQQHLSNTEQFVNEAIHDVMNNKTFPWRVPMSKTNSNIAHSSYRRAMNSDDEDTD